GGPGEGVRGVGLVGDVGERRDRWRSGPDDPHALAGEVGAARRPLRGVVPLTPEALKARERGPVDRGEIAHCQHTVAGVYLVATGGGDQPAVPWLVVPQRGDAGAELDVAAQVENARNV